jgi:type IV secretion system protein VirB4
MQLLSPISTSSRDWGKEKAAGDHLPYLAQIDEHTLLLRDGRLMQVIMLDGLLFETADTVERN